MNNIFGIINNKNVYFSNSYNRTIKGIKYSLLFDGEIYNTNALRNIIIAKGYITENTKIEDILLCLYAQLENEMLKYINGMFNIAIYNYNTSTLFIAKDRVGIKPYYYANTQNGFIFSSTIKDILDTKYIKPIMSEEEILNLFSLNLINSSSKTYLKGIYNLLPSNYAIVCNNTIKIENYWQLKDEKNSENEDEIIYNLKYLIEDSIQKQIDEKSSLISSNSIDSTILNTIAKKNNYNIKECNLEKYKKIIISKEIIEDIEFPVFLNNYIDVAEFCKKIKSDGNNNVLSSRLSDEIFGDYYLEGQKNNLVDLCELLINTKLIQKGKFKNFIESSNNITKNHYKDKNYIEVIKKRKIFESIEKVYNSNNINVRMPYADYRIIEYLYNIPIEVKFGITKYSAPIEKYLLKKAYNLLDIKNDSINNTFNKAYIKILEEKLKKIISSPCSKITSLINTKFILNLIKSHGKNLNKDIYSNILYFLIQIEYFLCYFNVEICIKK